MQIAKEVVSISEMARMLGFSRARFYQLMKDGVLPMPAQSEKTKRPFFAREQQEKCIEVRRTNRGINGQAILFYAMRSTRTLPSRTSPRRRPRPPSSRQPTTTNDTTITELRHSLSQLGLTDVTARNIRTALVETYPDGHAGVESADLLRSVFGHLNRQNPNDNVAR